ncbi:MAG TPA: hypothetical protein VMC10_14490 [Stellaceae bacterium]|nr:hypothetical protein [Stellaceae bacterium]
MFLGRLLGWLFLILALIAEGHDIWGWLDTGHYRIASLGQLWYELDRGSLTSMQALIEGHVAGWLWDPVITTVLIWPGALSLLLPAVLLLWACRRRDSPRRRRRRR